MNNESFYMHPRYNEFLVFLKTLESDARITPNSLNLAFDVWLEIGFVKNIELLNENMILKAKADVFLKSCKAYEESNETLKAENDALKSMNDALRESNDILKQALNEMSE